MRWFCYDTALASGRPARSPILHQNGFRWTRDRRNRFPDAWWRGASSGRVASASGRLPAAGILQRLDRVQGCWIFAAPLRSLEWAALGMPAELQGYSCLRRRMSQYAPLAPLAMAVSSQSSPT